MGEIIENNSAQAENTVFLQLKPKDNEDEQIAVNYLELSKLDAENNSTKKEDKIKKWENTKLVINTVGILISFSLYAIMQEKITKNEYVNPQNTTIKEKFKFEFMLVFMLCSMNFIFAEAISLFITDKKDTTHFGWHLSVSVFVLSGMLLSNFALRWVSYPTQVVLKSSKPIAVMLLCVLISKKVYNIQRYLFVLMVVGGVILFTIKKSNTESKIQNENILIGEIILFVSLLMDGFTAVVQERMRKVSSPSAIQMMVATNAWSILIMFFIAFGSGQLIEFISFVKNYPYILWWILAQGVCGAIGQLFIFHMVISFGALSCSLVTTTRKFFTIIFSVIYFQNALSSFQWIATILIFVGLFADAVFGGKDPVKKIEKKKAIDM